jgi:ribose transport system permease protein
MQANETYKRQNIFQGIWNAVANYFRRNFGPILMLLALGVFLTFTSNNVFLTTSNIITVLRQISINGIVAVGISCVILVGCIDLSAGSMVAVAGCLVVVLNSMLGLPIWLSIIGALCAGLAAGGFNGFVRAKTLLPPFIITLAMQQTLRGIAYIFTDGYPVTSTDTTFNNIGNGYLWIIPIPVYIMAGVYLIIAVLLSRTKHGRHMYAVGGNMDAALHSGISYTKVVMSAYIISGLCAATAGIILAARMYSGQPTVGIGYEADAIAASVIGGTKFGGGAATMGGTLIGALIIGIINNGMNLLKINFYYQSIVKGLIILLAVYWDSVKYKMFERRKLRKFQEMDRGDGEEEAV